LAGRAREALGYCPAHRPPGRTVPPALRDRPLPEHPPVQIERAELFLVPLELREPFETSAGAVHVRSILLVALHGDGITGWGECVALETPHYSPETTETAWAALEGRLLPAVVGTTLTVDTESIEHL